MGLIQLHERRWSMLPLQLWVDDLGSRLGVNTFTTFHRVGWGARGAIYLTTATLQPLHQQPPCANAALYLDPPISQPLLKGSKHGKYPPFPTKPIW